MRWGSTSPTAATTTATAAAPTITSIPLLDANEVAWLKGVSAVRAKEDGTDLLHEADDSGRQIRADYG